MIKLPMVKACVYRFAALVVVISLFAVATSFAQTGRTYAVELAVSSGKKSIMTDADLTFTETGVKIVPDKAAMKENSKEFTYSNIEQADASFAKKPMLSGGGAV